MGKKKALIITDGSRTARTTALFIKQSLSDFRVKICPAKKFAGNDLLPVDVFFIGCKKPKPKTFTYLSELLAHINLASRKCGLFGANEKTVKYLTAITADSEVDYGEPLLASDDITQDTVNKWLKKIIQ
jgi:hypothetical protein